MTINMEDVLERAFEQAFARALEPTVRVKAEELFTRALSAGSPLSKKLEDKIEEGFERFLADGICWEKKKPGFKK